VALNFWLDSGRKNGVVIENQAATLDQLSLSSKADYIAEFAFQTSYRAR
jgi:hypothetical protein